MKAKVVYTCTNCDYQSPKWLGKCPSCGSWNTFEEETYSQPSPASARSEKRFSNVSCINPATATRLDELDLPDYLRFNTGCDELDRVLGGGLVSGSAVLLSGEPGIGKSTLLMQISGAIAKTKKVLYVSGEESPGQLKMRAKRLGILGGDLMVFTETNIDRIFEAIEKTKPDVIIADSVQTFYTDSASSIPGSITQVKECSMRFIRYAKDTGTTVIIVGHVNKDGAIAGPKVLEHMVDAVLCFEGNHDSTYRVIRSEKNRFGSTNELGVFEMTGEGLVEVPNPSEALLAGRPTGVSGNCAVCVMEGTRPIITEIQALVTKTVFPSPKRASDGIDYNRLYLLLAVLEKRINLKFSMCDAYLNVIGGIRLNEPAADLATALALISGILDKPVPDDLIASGELGLSGECRGLTNAQQRVNEAHRLGFARIALPARCCSKLNVPNGISVIPVKGIYDALNLLS